MADPCQECQTAPATTEGVFMFGRSIKAPMAAVAQLADDLEAWPSRGSVVPGSVVISVTLLDDAATLRSVGGSVIARRQRSTVRTFDSRLPEFKDVASSLTAQLQALGLLEQRTNLDQPRPGLVRDRAAKVTNAWVVTSLV
jgi:hypothetical protein